MTKKTTPLGEAPVRAEEAKEFRAAMHGDSDVCCRKRPRVVDPIADHDDGAIFTKRLHDFEFALGSRPALERWN